MVIADVLLDNEHEVQEALAREPDVTLRFDGWKDISRSHLLAFTIVTPRSLSAFTYNVQDVSADRKTGEAVAVLIHEQIRLLKDRYSSKVVAIVSDAAGEAAKARRLVQAALPYIIILNCFSHQINLMVAGTCNDCCSTTPMAMQCGPCMQHADI